MTEIQKATAIYKIGKEMDLPEDVITDAMSQSPMTEQGKGLKEKVESLPEDSEYFVSNSQAYDYNKHFDEHTLPLAVFIIKEMANSNAPIFFGNSTSDKEDQEIKNFYESLSRKILDKSTEIGASMDMLPEVFKVIQAPFDMLKNIISSEVSGHTEEVLARLLEARNPGTNKFDKRYATFGSLISALEKVRESTGGNNEDYFTFTK